MSEAKLSEGNATLIVSATDDGAGDFLVAIETQCNGFGGHADGHVVGAEWRAFLVKLSQLEKERKGAAEFSSANQGEFNLVFKAIDSRGHLGVAGTLGFSNANAMHRQQLSFSFEIDPSSLQPFLAQLLEAQQGAQGRRAEDSARLS
jgi:hypothetical protein